MAISKQDTAVAAGLGLLLLAGGKALASKGSATVPRLPLSAGTRVDVEIAPGAWQHGTVDAGGISATIDGTGDSKSLSAHRWRLLARGQDADDGAALMKRANQPGATAWAVVFADLPGNVLSPLSAAALARWAGIESSGIPVGPKNPSRLDERGLMQAGPASVVENELTQAEFDALKNPKTTRATQAVLAVKYVDALTNKAMTYVARPPKDPIDLIWYAKMWHQRPVDVRDGGMTGDAHADARRLAQQWAADPKAMHRLRAANVIAWGTPTP